MYTHFNAIATFACNAEMFNSVAELFCKTDIFTSDSTDALCIHRIELQRHTKRDRCHDSELMSRINAFNVKGWISLRVTEFLGFLQHIGKISALFSHLGQNKVTCAVDNSSNPFDLIGGKTLTQRFNDWNSARHRRLKS